MDCSEDRSEILKIHGQLLSPGFKCVAAMAGWDEEALLFASFVVEDTPDRESKHKTRLSSRKTLTSPEAALSPGRKRSSPCSPISSFCLYENEEKQDNNSAESKQENTNKKELIHGKPETPTPSCIERLREELSCSICLEICYEPSTTPCGHSFCKQCLRSAADKCGKRCPKCRQLIANAMHINTVLWNTIQLLFPSEIEARKKASSSPDDDASRLQQGPSNSESFVGPERQRRRRRIRISSSVVQTPTPDQDGDAALALRLQSEEFFGAFMETTGANHRRAATSPAVARANLRGMASRAANTRLRCQRN